MNSDALTAIVHSAWRRGRFTGLVEGLLVGLVCGGVLVALLSGHGR